MRAGHLLLVDNPIPGVVTWQLYDDQVARELDLVGISEIAEMVGVTRQRVDKISRTDKDFPDPVAEIHAGRIWLRSEVEAWATATGRQAR